MRNTKKGFTLVELLVVIAILAILATVSVVGYTNYIKNANESLALQELSQVKSSILAEDIVNNNFAIGSDGKVNAEGVVAFNAYLEDLAADLNGELLYADGKVTYTLEKDTSVVYVLDLKTGEVEAGTATQTPVTPPAGGEEGGETPVEPEPETPVNPEPETPTPKTATLQYTAGTTTNMTGNNDAATVGLDATIFSVVGNKGGTSNNCGLNKSGQVRLYGNKADGKGSYFTVTVAEGYTIGSIKITFSNTTNNKNCQLTVGETSTVFDGSSTVWEMDINSDSFMLKNVITGETTQIYISSIEITYIAD